MLSTAPSSFGYPGDNSQANYYLGDRITRDDLTLIAKVMEAHDIEPENTRVLKSKGEGSQQIFDVLQASTVLRCLARWDDVDDVGTVIRVCGGDHRDEMAKICGCLLQAKKYVANRKQSQIIDHYLTSFLTGCLDAFRESQKVWVTDKSPVIESIFGFVEPYRDPHGVRGEWESIVCISDPVESASLKQLVEKSDTFIRVLPWAVPEINNGKGPFEKELFEAPDFASVHGQY
jgi:dipeptidyl-peptidase-3